MVFHFDISGKDFKDLHPKNIEKKDLVFEVFQFDISGKDINESHPPNIPAISETLLVSHLAISGNDINGLDIFTLREILFNSIDCIMNKSFDSF